MKLTRRQLSVLLAVAWLRPAAASGTSTGQPGWLVIAPRPLPQASRLGWLQADAPHHWPWQPGQWLDLPALHARLDQAPDTWLYAEVDPLHHCLLLDLVRARQGLLVDTPIDTPTGLLAWLGPRPPTPAQRLPLAELPWLAA